jgi:AsmA protein
VKRLLKGFGILLAVLLGLLIAAVLALVLLFDPNTFKPRIEALAQEHNLLLDIQGDIDWQFWPALGLEIDKVAATTLETPDQPLAQLRRASLRVAVMPLFRREVQVEHIVAEGAVFNLLVDEHGRGNWEALITDEAAEQPPAADIPATPTADAPATEPATANGEEAAEFKLAVDRISLRNGALNFTSHYAPEQASGANTGPVRHLALQDTQLEVAGFNLQAQPFSVSLQWQGEFGDAALLGEETLTIAGESTQNVQLAEAFDTVDVTDGNLNLRLAGQGQSVPIELNYALALRDLQENLHYLGELRLAPVNLKQLLVALGQEEPATTNPGALTKVAFRADFSGDSNSLKLEPFAITLDATTLTGQAVISDFETAAMQLTLKGDTLNIDDYLAPTADTAEEPAQAAAAGDEEIIPLETLQALQADVRVDFDKLIVGDLPLTQARLRLTADEGLITLESLSANLYDGALATKGTLDARGDTAIISFESGVEALPLAPLMKDLELDEKLQLTGAINATAKGQTQGLTLNALTDNAKGQARVAGAQVRLAPLNIEQKFCEIVHLVNKTDAPKQVWPNYTELSELSGSVRLADGVIQVDQMTAGVAQLAVGVEGVVDLADDAYNLGLPLTLMDNQTSPNGCRVKSDFWLDRTLTLLRCRGSLEGLNPVSDCRPDAEGLTKLVRDFGAYKVKEKHGEKIEAAEQKLDEKKDELREKLQEKIGTEEGKKVEDRLRRLLKK